MQIKIDPTWQGLLQEEFEKPYFLDLVKFVKEEYKSKQVFPPGAEIFRAFDLTPVTSTRVVIIGQDPYHGVGQANGLCFSVSDDVRIPPSLQNIYKEIKADLGKEIPTSGNLERWAKQGVLLLNATLTVVASQPGSHQNKGWEEFTDAVIRKISERNKHMVFLLWGNFAQNKEALINNRAEQLILKSAHPSPFSAARGFFGCKHFSQTNSFLREQGLPEIDW